MPRPLYDRHPRFKKLASVSGDNLAPTHPDHPANFTIPGADQNLMGPINTKTAPPMKAKQAKAAKMPKPGKGK
jgi:hypothetical protein